MAITGNFATNISALVDSLTSAEKLHILNALYEDYFEVKDATDYHTTIQEVRDGTLIPIISKGDPYGALTGNSENTCTLNTCEYKPEYSTHKWSIGEYNCSMCFCLRNLDDDFLLFWDKYKYTLEDPTAVSDTDKFLAFLISMAQDRLNGAIWRTAYFGDTNSGNTLISQNDGFLVQADAGNGIKVNLVMSGSEPTGQEIYNALQEAYEGANGFNWGSAQDLAWHMPYWMANKIVSMLNTANDMSQYNCQCINPAAIVGARNYTVEGLQIFGIPVKAYREINGSMNAISHTDPYWVILAPDSNFLIGSNNEETIKQFDIFYDKKTKQVCIDLVIYVGAGIPLDDYAYIGVGVAST